MGSIDEPLVEGGLRLLILGGGARPSLDYAEEARRLRSLGGRCRDLGFAPVVRKVRTEAEVLENLDFYVPDLVLSTLAFLPGTSGRPRLVHEALARSGTAFVGSSAHALGLGLSPRASAERWASSGLPHAPRSAFGPTGGLLEFDRRPLYSAVVLGGGRSVQAWAAEVIRGGRGGGRESANLRPLPADLRTEVLDLAVAASTAMGLEDWARVDLGLQEGRPCPLLVAAPPPGADPLTWAIPALGGVGARRVLALALGSALERRSQALSAKAGAA